jgi:hypothetical protein
LKAFKEYILVRIKKRMLFRENYNMKIKKSKGDKCPICQKNITGENCWIRYHIRYNPPLVILACKYCNFIEYALRTNTPIKGGSFNMHRIKKVISFHSSFNFKL